MARPCECDRTDRCTLCRLYHGRADYRALWDAAGARPHPSPGCPCRHRGGEVGQVDCPPCRGRVRLKVFACAAHGACTAARVVRGLACCAGCPDHQPASAGPPAGPRRLLLTPSDDHAKPAHAPADAAPRAS